MKKNLILLSLLLAVFVIDFTRAEEISYDYDGYPTIIHSESAALQAWRPKFWNLHIDVEDGGFINMDYRQDGDTLIQGRQYVRVVFGYEEKGDLYRSDFLLMSGIRPKGGTYADTLYYRQEGDKVFCLQSTGDDEILIIDYGLKVGDNFTDANGNTYIVKETGRENNNEYFFSWYFYQPKKLNLISKQTGEEDIWIEGIGSKYWGITPLFLMERSKVFTKLNLRPCRSQVFMGYGGNLLLMPNVNYENYKAKAISEAGQYTGNDYYVSYEFIDDTLRVEGIKIFEHFGGYSYIECIIDNGQIDVMVKQFWMQAEVRENKYIFDVKIPGFKAGTYQVGMPGGEYVTLECKGPADGMNVVKPGAAGTDKRTYDLSGRSVSGKPQRGLYIENGRKVVTK
ncbi:MAG: hypothetical protein J5671_07150 [Bacteroidaceae bacterium]|nr:hypothetical protein [Bacteroidaceae bacterium]